MKFQAAAMIAGFFAACTPTQIVKLKSPALQGVQGTNSPDSFLQVNNSALSSLGLFLESASSSCKPPNSPKSFIIVGKALKKSDATGASCANPTTEIIPLDAESAQKIAQLVGNIKLQPCTQSPATCSLPNNDEWQLELFSQDGKKTIAKKCSCTDGFVYNDIADLKNYLETLSAKKP